MAICSLRPTNTVPNDVDIDSNEGHVEGNTEENEGDVQGNTEQNENADDVDTGSNEVDGEGNTEEKKDTDDVDTGPNEGDVESNTEENNITGNVQALASASSQSFSTPVVIKDHFLGIVRDTPCYTVYAGFSDIGKSVTHSLYALDIKKNRYMQLPNLPMNFNCNASLVLDYNLYVMGCRGYTFGLEVHSFDPFSRKWSQTAFPKMPGGEALAASVDGRIYVFGGFNKLCPQWAEVYEPSTKKWTTIVRPQTLTSALFPLRASAVLGKKIILRGFGEGLAFDVTSDSWNAVSNNLIKNWWNCIRAAVVQNMLITCYGDNSQPKKFQSCIRAYDPDDDVWLMLEGIDSSFHENAYRSEFMSVNGKLVIYHTWEQDDLTFSVIEINERVGTIVRANLLWQSRFPITTVINEGLKIHPGLLSNCVYKQRLLEAFRADV